MPGGRRLGAREGPAEARALGTWWEVWALPHLRPGASGRCESPGLPSPVHTGCREPRDTVSLGAWWPEPAPGVGKSGAHLKPEPDHRAAGTREPVPFLNHFPLFPLSHMSPARLEACALLWGRQRPSLVLKIVAPEPAAFPSSREGTAMAPHWGQAHPHLSCTPTSGEAHQSSPPSLGGSRTSYLRLLSP